MGTGIATWMLSTLLAVAPAAEGIGGPGGKLLGWLLAQKKTGPEADRDRLLEVLQAGETTYLDGGTRAAAVRFGALLIDPAFRKQAGTPAYDNVRYHLAGALQAQGAIGRARRLLLELISRDPPSAFRAPAFRKLVDLTLASGQLEQTLAALDGLRFTPDAMERDEIAYLKGKALMSLGHAGPAAQALGAVTRGSRLYAAANYLAGILALSQGRPEEAEEAFCRLVHGSGQGRTTFYLSDSAGQVVQHAWLALARLRHDQGDYRRAFDTYAHIDPLSRAWPQARYERAWSLYRAGELARARGALRRLLDTGDSQPERPMAQLLLGYALLGDCLFEEATGLFERIETEQAGLLEALTEPAAGRPPALPRAVEPLVPLTRTEQRVLALQAEVRGALQRVGWLGWELDRIGSGMPRREPARPGLEVQRQLERDRSRARGLLTRMADLRATLGEAANEQSKLEQLRSLMAQARAADQRAAAALERLRANRPAAPGASAAGATVPAEYLDAERSGLDDLGGRVADQHERVTALAAAANGARARRAERRVAGWARRAKLGQVDAVTGRKQALETEVQNLALGRYPLSVLRELAQAGQLGDDFEYWPYDGELWPDEYE